MNCPGCQKDITAFGCLYCGEAFDIDAVREEGRREILKEIAALGVKSIDSTAGQYCAFCRGENAHQPTCLWLRAQAVQDK